MHIRLAVFLIVIAAITSCSSRVAYEPPHEYFTAATVVNINTASADQFEKLPHIGRKTAEAIVAFREENGPFRRTENLLLIRGISEKRFAEIRQYLRTD